MQMRDSWEWKTKNVMCVHFSLQVKGSWSLKQSCDLVSSRLCWYLVELKYDSFFGQEIPIFFKRYSRKEKSGARSSLHRAADSSHDQRPRVKPSQVGSWSVLAAPGREVTKPTFVVPLPTGLHFPFRSVTSCCCPAFHFFFFFFAFLSSRPETTQRHRPFYVPSLRTHFTSGHQQQAMASEDINKRLDAGCTL
jgi:hypothetical protein